MLALPWMVALALGGDAVTVDAVRHAQVGYSDPSVTLKGWSSGTIDFTLRCAGRAFHTAGPIWHGSELELTLDGLPQGTHACSGELVLEQEGNLPGRLPVSFDVTMHPPLGLEVDRERLDLDAHQMWVRADRPLSRLAVEVFGDGGASIGSGTVGVPGALEADLEWAQSGGEPLRLVVTGWDEHDLPGVLDLFPWSYAIPHEDVVFDTGKAELLPREVHKLEDAWAAIGDVRSKFGDIAEVRLFVAGYTDTVGTAASNHDLSQRRARAIAGWFRDRGFAGPIHYQGFGEGVLAVATPDETDEQANRRALYLVAAEVPPVSAEVPRSAWKLLTR